MKKLRQKKERKNRFLFIIVGLSLMFLSCSVGPPVETKVVDVEEEIEVVEPVQRNVLVIVGEGGTSGGMFIKAAETYKKEVPSQDYHVANGDEFISAMKDFVSIKGAIDHLEYFGHGNNVGLYVNQAANVNGGLYANDPLLNEIYVAASIYELPADIFSENATIRFNGCNVAEGYPETSTLAQSFANYFNVSVQAPRGPTEFSRTPGEVDPIPNSKYLDSGFDEDVYMVPTYSDKAFVLVKPQIETDIFKDVREGEGFTESVYGLFELGLNMDYGQNLDVFKPYEVINYGQAAEFCRVAIGKECDLQGNDPSVRIRNLRALQMLIDASEINLKTSSPWYDSYVYWANKESLLTEDFVNKKWYTRGEMAQLSWNFRLYNL